MSSSLCGNFSLLMKEHFYHIGAKESNRNIVFESLLVNFDTSGSLTIKELDIDSV